MNDPRLEVGLDFDRLFRLRLVLARFGEMDRAKWWNTQGLLGPRGAVVLRRGFPRTHDFARARAVFAVARSRCNELFSPPGCITLWDLPAETEETFEEHWQEWLDQTEEWSPFFEGLAEPSGDDLLTALAERQLITDTHRDSISKLRRSAEGRAVPLPGTLELNDETITLLAGGFARGEPGQPAVPYARLEETA